jgi:hypothetical protein
MSLNNGEKLHEITTYLDTALSNEALSENQNTCLAKPAMRKNIIHYIYG